MSSAVSLVSQEASAADSTAKQLDGQMVTAVDGVVGDWQTAAQAEDGAAQSAGQQLDQDVDQWEQSCVSATESAANQEWAQWLPMVQADNGAVDSGNEKIDGACETAQKDVDQSAETSATGMASLDQQVAGQLAEAHQTWYVKGVQWATSNAVQVAQDQVGSDSSNPPTISAGATSIPDSTGVIQLATAQTVPFVGGSYCLGATAMLGMVEHSKGVTFAGHCFAPMGAGGGDGGSTAARPGDGLDNVSNFFAGFGDAVTFGLTKRIRIGLGCNALVDTNSGCYTAGGYLGTADTLVLGAVGNPCTISMKVINGLQALGNSANCVQDAANGNYGSAALDALGVLGNVSQLAKSCFAAGTPLLTPEGSKPIEDFRVGDLVLSAPEDDPTAPPEPRRVEELFQRVGRVIELRVGAG